jgi:hypothetical protein
VVVIVLDRADDLGGTRRDKPPRSRPELRHTVPPVLTLRFL